MTHHLSGLVNVRRGVVTDAPTPGALEVRQLEMNYQRLQRALQQIRPPSATMFLKNTPLLVNLTFYTKQESP